MFLSELCCMCSVIDAYSNPTHDNQQSEPGIMQSSIKKILRHKLYLGCLLRETQKFFLIAVYFLFSFYFLLRTGIFQIAKKLFIFLDIPKVKRRFKTLDTFLGCTWKKIRVKNFFSPIVHRYHVYYVLLRVHQLCSVCLFA